jgi:hypothetical protein
MLRGLRNGEARAVRVRYVDLWEQMELHLQLEGKGADDPANSHGLAYAAIRAAVIMLTE